MSTPHLINPTDDLDWVPLAAGLSFKPVTFLADDAGYQLLLRVEPGTVVPLHRHTGEIHSFVLSGRRRIVGCAVDIGPGTYVHEPVGNVDSWEAIGDEPCVLHVEANGRIEYLDADGEVRKVTDASTARAAYLAWCDRAGTPPLPGLT